MVSAVYEFRCNEDTFADYDSLHSFLDGKAKKWVFQLEQGEQTGYRHYQGRVSLIKKTTKNGALKLLDNKFNYLEPTSTVEHRKTAFYVMKEQTRIKEPETDIDYIKRKALFIPKKFKKLLTEIKPFQQSIINHPLNERQCNLIIETAGNLGKSTLLKHLNAGDYARAASHFADFKYAKVQGSTAKLYKVEPGTPVALPGLVARRAAEMALFLESAPVEMPQRIEPEKTKVEWSTMVWKALPLAAVGGAGTTQAVPYIPAVPPNFTETVSNIQSWKVFAVQVAALPKELVGAGAAALTCMVVLLVFHKMTSKPNA